MNDDDYQEEEIPEPGDSARMRWLMPVGRSGWAIAAGYPGLVSLLYIPAPFAVFCGVMGVRSIRRDPKKHGMIRAIFGIVMGLIMCTALLNIYLRS
jgi:hypothetical protein